MDGPLMGVDLKIERAKAKVAKLKFILSSALDLDRDGFSLDYDPKRGEHVCSVVTVPVLNPAWTILVGEVVFQLRSALDHLAWQLVELDGGTPGEQTQFPIRDTPLDRKSNLMELKARTMPQIKSPQILDCLDKSQPYARSDGTIKSLGDAHTNALWLVKVLNNIDKHRLLLATVCALDIEQMWWGLPAGYNKPVSRLNAADLEDGSPVAWFDFGGPEAPPDFNPHPSLKVVVREPEAPAVSHREIGSALEGMCSWIESQVIGAMFAPLFALDRTHGAPAARPYPL
jgi:hypothetical protein